MTTFEGIIYGIVTGLSEFLPVGSGNHQRFVSLLSSLSEISPSMKFALVMGLLLAVFLTYIHDWASMISALLQLLIYRKAPKTMDERMPLFVLIAVLPLVLASNAIAESVSGLSQNPIACALSTAAFGLLLGFADSWSKKNKNAYDWNWLDAILVGVAALATTLPGCGLLTAVLIGSLLRNYSREAAHKFSSLVYVPVLGGWLCAAWRQARETGPVVNQLGSMTFAVSLIVCFFSALLAIATIRKHLLTHTLKLYAGYRVLLGIGLAAWFYWKG